MSKVYVIFTMCAVQIVTKISYQFLSLDTYANVPRWYDWAPSEGAELY